MRELTLTRPDDWHLHLRDGAAMRDVLAHTARVFGRAIVMPNLKPPVTTVAAARAYRDRILAALPSGAKFEPLMTLYLTDNTSAAEIAAASRRWHIAPPASHQGRRKMPFLFSPAALRPSPA